MARLQSYKAWDKGTLNIEAGFELAWAENATKVQRPQEKLRSNGPPSHSDS